ncbi:hypothetical protein Dimus_021207, partial [Dionaea muscipula]
EDEVPVIATQFDENLIPTYDPNSSSSSDDEPFFLDPYYGVDVDDDEKFDNNVDKKGQESLVVYKPNDARHFKTHKLFRDVVKDDWLVVNKPILHAPDVVTRSERPKKARRREPEEPDPTKLGKKGVKMTCHGCGEMGT